MLTSPPILDRLAALADGTRSRILLLLDRHELTVSELCAVLQLPQSTVSRHLKILNSVVEAAKRDVPVSPVPIESGVVREFADPFSK